jgi:hypothetical protein
MPTSLLRPIAPALLAAGMLTLCLSGAAAREFIFIVEEPLFDPVDPLSDDQRRQVASVDEMLTQRVKQLQIDGHVPIDGRDVARQQDAKLRFQNADLIVQVLLTFGGKGAAVVALIYEKVNGKWSSDSFAGGLFGPGSASTLEAGIANEVLPKMLVRLFELAQPERAPLLFVDCLFPPKGSAALQEYALNLSVDYGGLVSAMAALRQRFRIVRFVQTPYPEFYKWWCVQLDRPRIGTRREDTTTVYGYVTQTSQVGKPELRLAASRRQRTVGGDDPIAIDARNNRRLLKRITDKVERLTHDL